MPQLLQLPARRKAGKSCWIERPWRKPVHNTIPKACFNWHLPCILTEMSTGLSPSFGAKGIKSALSGAKAVPHSVASLGRTGAPVVTLPISKRSRLTESDVLRGFLLLGMTLTHLPTKASSISNQMFGFVSDAEGFIFLAAFLIGQIEQRKQQKGGIRRSARRLEADLQNLLLSLHATCSHIHARGRDRTQIQSACTREFAVILPAKSQAGSHRGGATQVPAFLDGYSADVHRFHAADSACTQSRSEPGLGNGSFRQFRSLGGGPVWSSSLGV
jgi:hypothetical protein